MKTNQDVIFFETNAVAPETLLPAPERLLGGKPTQTLWNHYSDGSGQFHTGIWASEPGKWIVKYTEHEYCHLLEGRIQMTDTQGNVVDLKPGDDFVIPAGYEGTWEVIESAKKVYVIFEPRQPS